MADKIPLEINVDKILSDKAGKKARYVPRPVVRWLKHILHQEEINDFLTANRDLEGVDWLEAVIKHLDVTIDVKGLNNLQKNTRERYTFASNHPLGGIDGVALGMVLGRHFNNNVRYLLNDILMNLPGLRPLGVPVNVTGAQDRTILQKVDEVFRSDHHLIVFPAGLCSRLIDGRVQDLPWKKTVVQKSLQTGRSIVPVHFSGQNSKRFYRIANISKALHLKFNVAMLFLADEVYRNRGGHFEIRFGKPLPPQYFDHSRTHTEWAQWLRKQSYEL